MRITQSRLRLLETAADMEHAGGFYTANREEFKRCETLRAAGFLKF